MNTETESFDIDANHYKEHSALQFQLAEETLFLHTFRPEERILDIGCGDGKVTKKLAERVPLGYVEAIDPSLSMIELARATFPKKLFPNLNFSIGRGEEILTDKKYDLITAFCSLHWVRGQEKALQKMADSITPSGKILILTFPKESSYLRLLEDFINRKKWENHALLSACSHWISSSGYRALIKRLGLEESFLKIEDEPIPYESEKHFKEYVKGWLPCLIPLKKELQGEFLDELAAYAKEQFGCCGNEGFAIPSKKIVMYLKKA